MSLSVDSVLEKLLELKVDSSNVIRHAPAKTVAAQVREYCCLYFLQSCIRCCKLNSALGYR